jgi:hypothetical protein
VPDQTMSDVARKLTRAHLQAIFDRSPCIGWLRHRVASLAHERQEFTLGMGMRDELERRPAGDITGDFAIDRGTDDVRWATGDSAVARLGRSRTLGLVDIEVVDEDKLVALGRGTFANTPA